MLFIEKITDLSYFVSPPGRVRHVEPAETVAFIRKNSDFEYSKALHQKYFSNQWQHMLQSIEAFPNHSILLNSAAWLGALNDHELQKCLKYVEKAIKLQPSAANYDTRAEVQYRLKMYKEALESIEKAASLDKLEPYLNSLVK